MPFVVSLSLLLSRFPSPLLAWLHKRTSQMHTHINLSSPLFRSLPSCISNPALSLSPLFSEHLPFVPPVNFLSPRIPIYSPSLTSLDQVSRTKSCRKKEREGRRKRGLNYLPHRPPVSPPLPSQSVFTPIPRQHHRRARDLRVEHPSVFNAAPLTRAFSFLPLILISPSPPFSFLSLPPPLSLLISPFKRDLDLSQSHPCVRQSIPPPPSNSPLPLSHSEHVRPRVRARVPPRACRGRVKPCV